MDTYIDFVVRALSLICPFMLGFFVLSVGYVLGNAYLTRQRLLNRWAELARRTGLQMQEGGRLTNPSVIGSYQGYPLKLYTFQRGSSRNPRTYTGISLLLRDRSAGSLTLRPEKWLDNIEKALGRKDVEIGDLAFDQRYNISSDPPDFAARVLRADDPLCTLLMKVPNLRVHARHNALFFQQKGAVADPERLVTLFDALSQVANAVERVSRLDAPEKAGTLPAIETIENAGPPRYNPFGQRINWLLILFVLFLVSGSIPSGVLGVWQFINERFLGH